VRRKPEAKDVRGGTHTPQQKKKKHQPLGRTSRFRGCLGNQERENRGVGGKRKKRGREDKGDLSNSQRQSTGGGKENIASSQYKIEGWRGEKGGGGNQKLETPKRRGGWGKEISEKKGRENKE